VQLGAAFTVLLVQSHRTLDGTDKSLGVVSDSVFEDEFVGGSNATYPAISRVATSRCTVLLGVFSTPLKSVMPRPSTPSLSVSRIRKSLINDFTGFLFLGAFRLAFTFIVLPCRFVDLNFDVTFLPVRIRHRIAARNNYTFSSYNGFDEFRAKFSSIQASSAIPI
jgi:hypothetical protein